MLSNNEINEINVKKVCERISCPKCNKPNMSKKNINAHYKAACSMVWDEYKKPKEKKESKPRQPRKTRNKKISFLCSDFINFTNWLIDNQIILDEEDNDYFLECYQQFKTNQEPPKPPMIIKINIPSFNFKKEEEQEVESVHEQVEQSIEEEIIKKIADKLIQEHKQESAEQPVEEIVEQPVEFDNIYPAYEEESFKEENEMIEKDEDDEDDEEVREHEEYMRKEREKYDLENGIKEEVVEELTEEQLEWQEYLKQQEKIYFQEDEFIENHYFSMETEEAIEIRLSKFIERFDKKEIKKYSIPKKYKLNADMIKQRQQLLDLMRMDCISLYKLNSKKYDFILRNLIELIKLKIDKIDDDQEDELSQEEAIKLINTFDKNKILEKYNDYIKKWCDIAMK
jgi:hypothetical protein